MAFTAVANDTPTSLAPSPSMVRRLWSAIMRAREAQAQWRLASQLRDLPHDVLKDIGVEQNDIRRLSANSPTIFHIG
jgi:uncharacterized protein YjiS (DUF1127 family)